MKRISPVLLSVLLLSAAWAKAIDYSSFAAPGIIVTGVRSVDGDPNNVILTASYKLDDVTYAGLYQGSLSALSTTGIGGWSTFLPTIGTQDITNATLYGPNTRHYSSNISSGNIRAVGSYKYNNPAGDAYDHGLLYNGPANGTGTFTQIDANDLVSGDDTLLNTIAHSTMGDLVVGNYDTSLKTGNAFVYNMSNNSWFNLVPNSVGPSPASVTAYGIWQNADGSYTIAGGVSSLVDGDIDTSYLVNYDAVNQTVSNYREYTFQGEAVITHFDGITATDDGFNLTGDYIDETGEHGFFVSVTRNPLTGAFGPAENWTSIDFPGGDATSGNTIVGNNVLGIYTEGGTSTSYVAAVPEPSTWAMLALGAGLVLWRFRPARREV